MGGRWLTSAAWLEEFGRRLTPDFEGSPTPQAPVARRKAADRAERELDTIGI
jgi:hypothetical protein